MQIVGVEALQSPHGPSSWSRKLISYYQGEPDKEVVYLQPETPHPLLFSIGENVDMGELLPGTEINYRNLLKLVNSVDPVNVTGEEVSDYVRLLCALADDPNIISLVLSAKGKEIAENTLGGPSSPDGAEADRLIYEIIVGDEITRQGVPLRPSLRIAHLLENIQRQPGTTDIRITYGHIASLAAIVDRERTGTPTVFVDHVISSDTALLDPFVDEKNYSEREKRWFTQLYTLSRAALFRNIDLYLAMWPVNYNLAVNVHGIPSEKVVLIPNGVAVSREFI